MTTEDKVKRTVIVLEIEPILHRDFKIACAYQEVDMKQMIANLVKEYTYSVITISESPDENEAGKIFINMPKDE